MRTISSYLLLPCAIVVGAVAHADPPLEHVTLQLKWKHQFQFAGYYVALEKGFYREAGLDVSILPAEPGKPYIDPVLNGHAAFGVASSELAVLRAQGKPVVALAPIYQHSPLVLIVAASSNIDNVHELAGKRIMIAPEEAEVFAYLQAEGLDLKSLQLIPHTYSPKELVANKVDAVSGYSTDEPFDLEMDKFKFSLFKPRSGGIDFYADTLFTTEDQIRDHPDRVKRFLEASLRGWQYAFAHTNEVIDLILEKYAPEKSRAHLVYEADESRRLIQPDLVELGYSNPGRWKEIAEAYDRLGMMPKEWSIDGLLYDRHPNQIPRWVIGALGTSLVGHRHCRHVCPLSRAAERGEQAAGPRAP